MIYTVTDYLLKNIYGNINIYFKYLWKYKNIYSSLKFNYCNGTKSSLFLYKLLLLYRNSVADSMPFKWRWLGCYYIKEKAIMIIIIN